MIRQKTISEPIKLSGIGLHSGRKVNLVINPAPVSHGIVYSRVDLNPPVQIKAVADLVRETTLCTCLINDDGIRVQTIEHLSSAIAAYGIDNLLIEIDNSEIPILDGSALPFVYLFNEVGIVDQDQTKLFIEILKPVKIEDGDKWVELLPILKNQPELFRLDFEICFDHQAIVNMEKSFSFDLNIPCYVEEISRARTFGFLKDIEYLQENGLCLGGSLDSAVVLDQRSIINSEGLRYHNELVRHKILDAIGDLFVCNHNLIGYYNAFKSGHYLNNLLIQKLIATPDAWRFVILQEDRKLNIAPKSLIKIANQTGAKV